MPAAEFLSVREKFAVLREPKQCTKIIKKPEFQQLADLAFSMVDKAEKQEAQIKELHEEIREKEEEVRLGRQEIAVESERLSEEHAQVLRQKEALDAEYGEQLETLQEQVTYLTSELAGSEARKEQIQKHLDVCQQELSDRQQEIHGFEEEIQGLKVRNEELEAGNFQLLKHTEEQQKELAKQIDAAAGAKEKELKATQERSTY